MQLFDRKTGKVKQTRLSYHLRKLELVEDQAARRDMLANNLDKTAVSLGLRGDEIPTCAAYRQANQFYQSVTGKAFGG